MEFKMTRDEIKKIVFDQFYKNYNIDLNTLDEDFSLAKLKDLNEKLDSLEVITFMSELEDIFKINTITIESSATTIKELIDYLVENMDVE
jgi:acyl carrier protein